MNRTFAPVALLAGLWLSCGSQSVPGAEAEPPPVLGRATGGNAFGVTYENLRGTNYVFNTSHLLQEEFGLLSAPGEGPSSRLPGSYSERNIESDLAMLAASGFNNVRITTPFFGWVVDNDQFETNLRHFLASCRENQITVTWVLWSAIGNAPFWQSVDLADGLGPEFLERTNEALYATLASSRDRFQQALSPWVPPDRLGYGSGYPMPGNKLLRSGGDPTQWTTGSMHERLPRYLDTLMDIVTSPDGEATLFQFDLGNELDTVGIPVAHSVAFMKWTRDRIAQRIPHANYTIGWAENDVPSYASYVDEMARLGLQLTRHSFHAFVFEVNDYFEEVEPLLAWGRGQNPPIRFLASEFYRTDRLEQGRLGEVLDYFASRDVATIMWGFLPSNIYTRDQRRIDGVLETTNAIRPGMFGVSLRYAARNRRDLESVLRFNGLPRDEWPAIR